MARPERPAAVRSARRRRFAASLCLFAATGCQSGSWLTTYSPGAGSTRALLARSAPATPTHPAAGGLAPESPAGPDDLRFAQAEATTEAASVQPAAFA
ncbi:MAG: hypothetical protein AAF907_14060, partial [Planctomycetota bacterium]